eukprot:IDg18253t1
MGWNVFLFGCAAYLVSVARAQPPKSTESLALSGVYSRFNLRNAFRPITLGGLIYNLSTNELVKPVHLPGTVARQASTSNSTTAVKALCPLQMRLNVSENNGALQIILPKGLVATYGDCKPVRELKTTSVALGNYASALGGLMKEILGSKFETRKMQFFSAVLPKGVLHCKGDDVRHIDALALVPIIDVALINFHTIFSAMGVNQLAFEDFFGSTYSSSSSLNGKSAHWNTVFAQEAKTEFLRTLN